MRGYIPTLGLLAALWGSGYLFIKVAVGALEPTTLMAARVVLAAAMLMCFLAFRGQLGALRRAPRGAYLIGIVNAAIPFTLIAFGEKYVDSGTAAIANAGVPLFVAMLAPFWPHAHAERIRGIRLAGLLLGLGGVSWLVGLNHNVDWPFVAGTVMIVVAALSFAVGALYGQHLVASTSGPVIATAAYIGASCILLPFGLLQAPRTLPDWQPLAALLALALIGTAIAQLLWFELLAHYGSSRSSLATYLVPGFALAYGSILASEPLGIGKIGAFALIVAGVVLASGRDLSRVAPPEAIELEAIEPREFGGRGG